MDGEAMQKSLDDILKGEGPKKDFEITNEEATKFKAAMADPAFQSMLRDYMEEMQDPANRAEQETYISELENQNRVPEGKEVVHPVAGFVIKTKFHRGSKDLDSEKLFVNVVTSDKIASPYSKPSSGLTGGESWSLPVAVGPLRMEKDKGGGSTTTFDVCYHPEALVRARRIDAFRDLLALSSLERVEDAFLRSTQQKMTADKSYRLLKGVKYKSGPCATMIVAKADINRASADAGTPGDRGENPATRTAQAEAKSPTGNPTKERKCKADRISSVAAKGGGAGVEARAVAAEPKAAGFAEAVGGDGHLADKSGDTDLASPEPVTTSLSLAPGQKAGNGGAMYKLVESGAFDLADHTSDRLRKTSVPQALIATVSLPADAVPTRNLDVVVVQKRLTIGVLGDPDSAPPRYLDLALPYEVEDDSKCKAARSKSGLLTITMPVKPPPPPPQPLTLPQPISPPTTETMPLLPPLPPSVDTVDSAEDGKETLTDDEYKSVQDVAEEKGSPSPSPAQQRKPDHSRWLNKAPRSEEVSHQPREAVVDPTVGDVENAAAEKNAPSREREDDKDTASDAASGDVDAPPPVPPRATPEASGGGKVLEDPEGFFRRKIKEDAPFIACSTFWKRIDGYDFKKDIMDCGYYRNDRGAKRPTIEWNETIKTMCGVVDVANVVNASVRYVFPGNNLMSLSFEAKGLAGAARGGGGGGEEGPIERYRTELMLAGGVDVTKCSHDTAEDNLVLKLAKQPESEWGVHPTPTKVVEVAATIDNMLDRHGLGEEGAAAAAAKAAAATTAAAAAAEPETELDLAEKEAEAAAAAAAAAAALEGAGGKEDGGLLAPGHGGLGSTGVGFDVGFGLGGLTEREELHLAYELD